MLDLLDTFKTLKKLRDKLCALVYCQRNRTPYNSEELKVLQTDHGIRVFSIVNNFRSLKKKNPEILENFNALDQSAVLELRNLDFFLRKENQLTPKTDKSLPKRLSKCARNAIKNASSLPSSQ